MEITTPRKIPLHHQPANQSRVTPIELAQDILVRLATTRFVMSFVVMDLPKHNSFSALLGRPWLRASMIEETTHCNSKLGID